MARALSAPKTATMTGAMGGVKAADRALSLGAAETAVRLELCPYPMRATNNARAETGMASKAMAVEACMLIVQTLRLLPGPRVHRRMSMCRAVHHRHRPSLLRPHPNASIRRGVKAVMMVAPFETSKGAEPALGDRSRFNWAMFSLAHGC